MSPLSFENDGVDVIRSQTPNKRFSMTMRAISLPSEVTSLLEQHAEVLKMMCHHHAAKDTLESTLSKLQLDETLDSPLKKKWTSLKILLSQAFIKAGWRSGVVDKILSFGPRRCGPNLLINKSSLTLPSLWSNETCPEIQQPIMEHLNSFING